MPDPNEIIGPDVQPEADEQDTPSDKPA